jgi:outer membrane protein OmpA-like peptidoglycan-associated protein
MRRFHAISIVLLVGVLASRGVAHAQEQPEVNLAYAAGFDPEQFAASADPDQISVVDGARTQTKGTIGVGLTFNFAGPALFICVRDGATDDPACRIQGDILHSRLRADLGMLYGFGRFDVRLNLPFVLHQTTDFSPTMGEQPLGSAGVGNPRIGVRYQIARPGSMNLAADLAASIPTGGGDFIGDKGLVVDPRLLFDLRRGRLAFGVNLGYRFRQDSAQLADLYVDDEVTWSVATEYWLSPRRLAIGAAAYGRVGFMKAPADPVDMNAEPGTIGLEELPAEAVGSLRFFVSPKLAIDVGGGAGLTPGYGAAPFRVLVGMHWVDQKVPPPPPLVTDRDRDGIDDSEDECPKQAEDQDGFEDMDGCPDPDNDGDGVNDDTDQCPLAAEDADGFADGDGCPEDDNDGDGVKDSDDPCPDLAEDKDGIKDGDGCPEGDNDEDGLEDGFDACPNEPEDKDGFVDGDGCPEADADGDGLKDELDKCPLEAEVFNDTDDEDGCPDEGRTLAVVEGDAVVIAEKIFFDLNRARIKTRSQPVMNAVAAILRAHADLKVRIEGNTDDRGTAEWNRELSLLRSNRVRDYLIKKGIDADRLEAVGFGADRPLVEGITEAAREKNRRVDFVIIGRTGEAITPAVTPDE